MRDDNIIYAQVLLLDGKIENWKICQDKKNYPLEFKAYWKKERVNDYTMETFIFKAEETDVPKGWNFNSYVYNVLAPRWINQWEYADDYRLGRSMEKTLDELKEELESLNKSINEAFGGRFQIIGQLGAN